MQRHQDARQDTEHTHPRARAHCEERAGRARVSERRPRSQGRLYGGGGWKDRKPTSAQEKGTRRPPGRTGNTGVPVARPRKGNQKARTETYRPESVQGRIWRARGATGSSVGTQSGHRAGLVPQPADGAPLLSIAWPSSAVKSVWCRRGHRHRQKGRRPPVRQGGTERSDGERVDLHSESMKLGNLFAVHFQDS
ncbi:hypothetical protein VTK73DRAFT_2397 [Phialemonium thermophilum]|uniref:Uncharacterized protein n=1 Tax=Phialemonium thermophilum TaxID=223376 RepID=A0ABR3VS65_9PEZI